MCLYARVHECRYSDGECPSVPGRQHIRERRDETVSGRPGRLSSSMSRQCHSLSQRIHVGLVVQTIHPKQTGDL